MTEKEWKIILEAQLPESYGSTKASVEDEQEEASNAAAPSEPSKTAAQQAEPSQASFYEGYYASAEFAALYVGWPFKAPPRAQTSMPLPVANMIDTLPTTGEKMAAKNLWNRSLPIAANVGIIEYNMVNEEKFREKVDEKYGEEWGRRLGDLARGLNEAAGVILGKHKGEELEGTVFDECSRKGKEPEGKTIELPERQGKKPEVNDSDETEPKAKEPKTKTLDHLAEACALAAQTGEKLPPALATTNSLSAETGAKAKEPETKTLEQLAEACTLAAQTEEDIPSFLATTNSLSALWYLLTAFFTSGPCAASYYFVALEAAIRHCSTTIHPLYIPAPPTFWTAAANWTWPAVGLTLILTLASSEKTMFAAFARFSRSLSAPALTVDEMRTQTPSMSLRKAVLRAKDDAERKGRTTVLGVNLRDVGYSELFEIYGQKAVDKEGFATFARMFALGICPGGGAKLWLVGGGWGEVGTVWEGNQRLGAGVGEWEELDEFVKAFEGVVGVKGQWNSKRFKWYHRCFKVDLKQFDLLIDDEEKKKRGKMLETKEGGKGPKKLLNEIEAWVEIYKVEDVKLEDVGKFRWL